MNREDVAMDVTFENLDILRKEVQAAKLLLSECDEIFIEEGISSIELRGYLSGKLCADEVIELLASQQGEQQVDLASYMKGGVSERDWPEDFQHENGQYMCRCHECENTFIGYKRARDQRIMCAMALSISAVGEALGIPGEQQEGGTGEFIDIIEEMKAAQGPVMAQAWLDVQEERRRQIEAEGWTPEHDDKHGGGQMARAAACYALAGSCSHNDETAALLVDLAWPWTPEWWKPSTSRRDLVKAAALILAELERLDRAAAPSQGE